MASKLATSKTCHKETLKKLKDDPAVEMDQLKEEVKRWSHLNPG